MACEIVEGGPTELPAPGWRTEYAPTKRRRASGTGRSRAKGRLSGRTVADLAHLSPAKLYAIISVSNKLNDMLEVTDANHAEH